MRNSGRRSMPSCRARRCSNEDVRVIKAHGQHLADARLEAHYWTQVDLDPGPKVPISGIAPVGLLKNKEAAT